MSNPTVSNPNDFKVVSFHNSTNFGFLPAEGCMYDGRPINGKTGAPGIDAGETVVLPYHIAQRLATNLAKLAMIRGAVDTATQLDAHGQPIVASLWDDVKLDRIKNSYLTDLYSEEKPAAQSETDKLMAKVEEYKKMVDQLLHKESEVTASVAPGIITSQVTGTVPVSYQDKQEVIAELEKRNIKHDKRQTKETLEKLLTPAA